MKNVDYDDNNDEDNEKDFLDNFALIIFNNDDDSLEYQNNSFW